MAKRPEDINNDFDYSIVNQEDLPGGAIGMYDPSYKPIEIDSITEELTAQSKTVISEIVEVYFKAGEIERPAYIDTLEKVEAMNLESMLVQVKYADHMIQSLMRRLNETGTLDNQLFRLIMDAQNHALQLTMNVANYVRNLPQYFKGLKFELSPEIPSLLPGNFDEQQQIGNIEDPTQDDGFINRPQMGTKDLLRCIENAQEQAAQRSKELDEQEIPNYSVPPIAGDPIDSSETIQNDNPDLFKQPSGMESVPPSQGL